MPTHSTPSGVVIEYFESLRWLVRATEASQADLDIKNARRLSAMSIIMAVTAVEVFLNLWFRIHATELKNEELQNALTKDLDDQITLEKKLSIWPKRHLHKKLDLKIGPGQAFSHLKKQRNSIIHFESLHETIHSSNIIIHGLANTTDYDSLSATSAVEALSISENLIAEIFRLAGFDSAQTETALAMWIGRPKINASAETPGYSDPPWLAPHVER